MLKSLLFGKPLLFGCNLCGECCRQMIVPLNHFDLARLHQAFPNQSLLNWVRLAPIEPEDPDAVRLEKSWRQLCLRNRGPEEGCVFLKDNSCSIYQQRPSACRTWPLDLNAKGQLEVSPAHHLLYTTACDKTPFKEARPIQRALRENVEEFKAYRRLLKQWNALCKDKPEKQHFEDLWAFLKPFASAQPELL
ncbi:MAG: YkgJ family cysteine cluster protein [Candidatus Sericytochromatia bacterium]